MKILRELIKDERGTSYGTFGVVFIFGVYSLPAIIIGVVLLFFSIRREHAPLEPPRLTLVDLGAWVFLISGVAALALAFLWFQVGESMEKNPGTNNYSNLMFGFSLLWFFGITLGVPAGLFKWRAGLKNASPSKQTIASVVSFSSLLLGMFLSIRVVVFWYQKIFG